MADTVAYVMENMVGELEEFEERGIFTRAEIKRIVAARTRHEYSLKRRATQKVDFLRAIEYEEQLETLRRHRRRVQAVAEAAEAAAAEAAEGGPAAAKSRRRAAPSGTSSDHAILRRIHFLYTRALRKFKGDLRLWARLFAFCRAHGGTRALSRALASALALHPTQAGLWSYASAWELRCRRDVTAARALMQRGLRACPRNGGLFADYFGMEVAAAELLRGRAEALGMLDGPGTAAEAEGEEETDTRKGRRELLRGAVAEAVFDSAAAALPDDLELRRRCLQALEGRGEWVAPLRARVLASLSQGRLALDASAVALRAQACARPADATALFERALSDAAGDASACAALADAFAAHLSRSGSGSAAKLQALARRALASGFGSEPCLLLACEALAGTAACQDAARELADAGLAALPASPRLWALRLEIEASRVSASGEGKEAVVKLAARALRSQPPGEEAQPLWRLALQLCAALGADPSPLHEVLRAGMCGGAGPLLGEAAAAALRCAALRDASGGDAARELAGALEALPGAPVELFVQSLRLEVARAVEAAEGGGAGAAEALRRARGEAERAVRTHGRASERVWAEFMQLELAAGGGAAAAGALLWRARKALGDSDALSWVKL